MSTCSRSRCNRKARSHRQRYCLKHHAEAMRNRRKVTKLSPKERRKMNCRSYLHVYVKRGKIRKRPCEICRKRRVEGHHEDHRKPLKVRWLCREHHVMVTRNLLCLLPELS